jgi:hypothetical protein
MEKHRAEMKREIYEIWPRSIDKRKKMHKLAARENRLRERYERDSRMGRHRNQI